MATRQPIALSLSGFQFTYRSSYFDWRLLHGIDVDTVIRLTDVQAVEDCLDTLQRGCFPAERDRLSPGNCVQLFRLVQLALEYCAHLRAAHALLLDCYNTATTTAESWKVAARMYLEEGSAFVSEGLATAGPGGGGGGGGGGLLISRGGLDATDAAKAALEGADREYNAALDALEAEDSRARHFRFRKQRAELSWSQLHAADADRLVASGPLESAGVIEGLLPNLTYGSITNEDDEQLTPHHFGQLIPLAQAALDYVLWQANATGALLEQAMTALQAVCADIPMLTTATQDLHAHITSLLLGGQPPATATATPPGGLLITGGGATPPMTAGPGAGGGLGGGGGSPLPGWGPADLGQPYGQYGSGRLGAVSPGFTRVSSPAILRPGSGGPGGSPQVLRLGPSRLGTPGPNLAAPYAGGLAAFLGPAGAGVPASNRASSSFAAGALDEFVAAAALASGGDAAATGAAALPVLELHSRTAELTYKVDAIEQDLRLERSKTEEMRRILTDVRDRLNQQHGGGGGGGSGTATPPGGGDRLSPVGSLTFPAAAAATLGAGVGLGNGYLGFDNTPSAAAGGGGGLRYGSAAGVSVSGQSQFTDVTSGPSKVRVFVDEDAIREQERHRAVQVLARQAEKLKQQMLREHQERRLATSVAASVARASLQLQQLGGAVAAGGGGGGGGGKEGVRHSRQGSRDVRRAAATARRSSPGKTSRAGSSSQVPGAGAALRERRAQSQTDYGSDPELTAAVLGGGGGSDPRVVSRQGSGSAAAAANRPPRPLSRLSGPTMHGSLGDLPVAAVAAAQGVYGMGAGGGAGLSRMAMAAGVPGQGGAGGGRGMVGPGQRGYVGLTDSAEGDRGLRLGVYVTSA
ncbi:hypothetical protein PLESTM_001657600 [Pleodorina starrii]|nr:hypothetical protein PLESTM_001657600 [Pleodorina starrii]